MEIWDLGGNGDCGYRAVAGLVARANGKDKTEVENKAEKLGISLKAKLVAHLKVWKVWEASWVKDTKATEDMEDGPVPGTAQEWVEALKRKKIVLR